MDFQKEVIGFSHKKPVLVDFWAEWCGPCRFLGPILEELAEEQKDRWKLVKVNTEEEQELAMNYQIRSIPNVKLFYQGKVIDEFAGALPKVAIQKWLDENLPDPVNEEIISLLNQSSIIPDPVLEEKLSKLVKVHPESEEIRIALARHKLFTNPEDAARLVDHIALGHKFHDVADDIRILKKLATTSFDPEIKVGKKLALAQKAFLDINLKKTIEHLIEATESDKNYLDDLPRIAAIALFRILGNKHELTKAYRWKFDMVLY